MNKSRFLALFLLLSFCVTACASKETDNAITEITFERGHGSAWGNQFYIKVRPDQVITLRYIPENGSDLNSAENLPITDRQWQALTDQLQNMTLQKEKASLWPKLFAPKVLDGGAFWKLSVTRGNHTTAYLWPGDEQAAIFEQLLEQLAREVIQ